MNADVSKFLPSELSDNLLRMGRQIQEHFEDQIAQLMLSRIGFPPLK